MLPHRYYKRCIRTYIGARLADEGPQWPNIARIKPCARRPPVQDCLGPPRACHPPLTAAHLFCPAGGMAASASSMSSKSCPPMNIVLNFTLSTCRSLLQYPTHLGRVVASYLALCCHWQRYTRACMHACTYNRSVHACSLTRYKDSQIQRKHLPILAMSEGLYYFIDT